VAVAVLHSLFSNGRQQLALIWRKWAGFILLLASDSAALHSKQSSIHVRMSTVGNGTAAAEASSLDEEQIPRSYYASAVDDIFHWFIV
jgi:hypothetical protein